MYIIWIYSLTSVILVSLLSLVGILTLSIKEEKLKKFLIFMVSFAAGALFGDVFLHLLPEVFEETGFGLNISLYILSGIAFSFVVEKIIHWRHCHLPNTKEHMHPFAMMNLFGDSVHNFIDGMIIGASYLASIPIGLATTLAVILHEIPQEIGDFGVLLHGGFSRARALFFNFLTALTGILGAAVSLSISRYVENLNVFLMPFAAGSFIYIAGSDLIPEMHKEVEAHKSLLQFFMIALGVAVMLALLGVE